MKRKTLQRFYLVVAKPILPWISAIAALVVQNKFPSCWQRAELGTTEDTRILVGYLLLAGLLALGFSACGDAPDPATPFPSIDSTDARTHDLMTLVVETDSLSLLAEALQRAGLAETLRETGPYTLFAPTDQAFRRDVPALDTLLADSAAHDSLRALLELHLVRGRLFPADVIDSLQVSTLHETPLTLRRTPSGASLRVRGRDAAQAVEARNGVLYALPLVLQPAAPDTSRRPGI